MSNIVNSVIAIRDNAMEVQYHGQCLGGYLKCYFTVSHSHTIPHIHLANDVGLSHTRGLSDDVSPPPPGIIDQRRLHMITILSNNSRVW